MAEREVASAKSISIPMSTASVAMNDLIINGTHKDLIEGGYEVCIAKMDNNKIKPGRILALVRSFEHHELREGHDVSSELMTRLRQIVFKPKVIEKAKEKLAKMGQPDRDFAYVHTAIYVGKGPDGKHYVAENAGGVEKEEGAWLKLNDVKSAFNDIMLENSKFLVIKPNKSHDTAQRAMAALHNEFSYKYNGFGFNCETFTSVCAGLFVPHSANPNDEVEVAVEATVDALKWMHMDCATTKGTKANPFERKINDRVEWGKVRKGAFEKAQNERQYYVRELKLLFLEHQSSIDGGKFKLVDDGKGGVCTMCQEEGQD